MVKRSSSLVVQATKQKGEQRGPGVVVNIGIEDHDVPSTVERNSNGSIDSK